MLLEAVQGLRNVQDGTTTPLPTPAATPMDRLSGLRVLLAEDNPVNQTVARKLLDREGCEVTVAHNGAQAVSALASDPTRYDVVLMDMQMPEMDGLEATRRIRQQLGLTALPIIAMTANAMSSDRQACLEAGMNDHVSKPFDLQELVELLQPYRTAAQQSDMAQTG
jgi:two-component system, sensor histidine kinase and response regulator